MSLDTIIMGNTALNWIRVLCFIFVLLVCFKVLIKLLEKKLFKVAEKTKTQFDDYLVELVKKTKFILIIFFTFYLSTLLLKNPGKSLNILRTITILLFLLQSIIWGNCTINFWITKYKNKKLAEDPSAVTTVSAVGFIGKLILLVVIGLLILDNLGVDITALVAGLGVGGIAVALAVQNILGDLLASLSIVLDKPFVLGDFIIVDDHMGSVEYIGLKTTRIRSLSGEQIVFSNNDLLSSRISNYKRMFQRRVVFTIGVVYQTPKDKLEKIPRIIKEIIENCEETKFDRSHFAKYGDFSLDFETVYFVLNSDYNKYMDIQQTINLKIFEIFEREKIEFAYPTQTLFVEKS